MGTSRSGTAPTGILLLACLALVAACGGSGGATSAPTADGQGAATAAATRAAATPGSDASAAAGSGDCATWKEVATTISLETQLLYQADSADQWASMTDPGSPLVLSGDRMAAAVDVLSKAPGSGDLVAKYRVIADLEKQAVAMTDPWGGGSGPGAQVQQKVQATFVELGVALGTLLDTLGC
jgi:hypothetical protein